MLLINLILRCLILRRIIITNGWTKTVETHVCNKYNIQSHHASMQKGKLELSSNQELGQSELNSTSKYLKSSKGNTALERSAKYCLNDE